MKFRYRVDSPGGYFESSNYEQVKEQYDYYKDNKLFPWFVPRLFKMTPTGIPVLLHGPPEYIDYTVYAKA